MSSPPKHVVSERQGLLTLVTISRAHKKNALDRTTVDELCDAIAAAERDPAVRGVVLRAEGDVFLSGGDLDELALLIDAPSGAEAVMALGERLALIERCALPVVAAVTGDVYGGGCELLLLVDAVFAEERARFSFRHARMGLSPAWGGASRLLERVGPLEAARLLFTSDAISAAEAAQLGLINGCVSNGAALSAAVGLLDRVAKNDRQLIAAHKRLLVELRAEARGRARALEASAFASAWGGEPHRAAMAQRRK